MSKPKPSNFGKPLDCVGKTGEVDKHDFQPSGDQIVHGAGNPHGDAERYMSEKITELALTQQELRRVVREKDALVRVVHLAGAMAGHPKDANEACRNICKLVRDTKDKLESGELRKPGA